MERIHFAPRECRPEILRNIKAVRSPLPAQKENTLPSKSSFIGHAVSSYAIRHGSRLGLVRMYANLVLLQPACQDVRKAWRSCCIALPTVNMYIQLNQWGMISDTAISVIFLFLVPGISSIRTARMFVVSRA